MDKISLIHETPDYLVLFKPAGVLMHGVKISPKNKRQRSETADSECSVADWLLENYPEVKNVGDDPENRPGIVHRLDKDTSGVVIIPRNQKFFDYLKDLFQNHQVKKTYIALVWGIPREKKGVIDKKIYLKPGSTKRSVFGGKMGKEATTGYETLESWRIPEKKGKFQEFSLLKITPKTGRTHQIRVHLASIGHPVVGDPLYGKRQNPFGLESQFLHADSLEFPAENPARKAGHRIRISADLPLPFAAIIDELRKKR